MARHRVLLAGFSHESNTFSSVPTTRADFQTRAEYVGTEILQEYQGTNSTVGGALEAAASLNVEFVPIVAASAQPGGPVTRDAYEHYVGTILAGIERYHESIDGVWLSLHGAMVPEGMDDGEGPLLQEVRERLGTEIPIVATLDLHGNVTDEMIDAADALVAYRTYPHVDTADTGHRALELLVRTIEHDVAPTMTIERPPVVPFTPLQYTEDGPMAEVMDMARDVEERPDVLVANVLPGFSHADVPSMGASVVVVSDDNRSAASDAARTVAEALWERRERFVVEYPSAEEAVEMAKDTLATGDEGSSPILLADTGDNPGGGSPADGTVLLESMLAANLENAGFALIRDPATVESAIDAGVGATVGINLGAKTDGRHGRTLELEVEVKTITDGQFRNTGPMGTGTMTNLGRTVRLHVDGVDIIVTEHRVQPLDAEIWRHVGVQPERLDVIALKSSNHYRAAYGPIASDLIPVATPGLTGVDPRGFDFDHIRRPMYPFDEMEGYDY